MPYAFKLIIFGDGGVGKTTLVHRYITGGFSEGTQMTIGVDFAVKSIQVGGESVDLQIWDFGGEDRFRFILPAYATGAKGGIFMYDITRPPTFLHVDDWMEVLAERTKDIPIIFVGTKADLETERGVPRETVAAAAKKYRVSVMFEVSSKTGYNVESAFETISKIMIKNTVLAPLKRKIAIFSDV
ncbi:MAG TPA: Rab family GTPase [Candidatus Lokiarchaeia archaeon]|nr:Rab family GTPase [Candidatus Lokiarchaeia archaeon]